MYYRFMYYRFICTTGLYVLSVLSTIGLYVP